MNVANWKLFRSRVRVYIIRQNNVHSDTPYGKEEKANEHYSCELCVVLCVFFLALPFYRHQGI